jgi:hypothetical protein
MSVDTDTHGRILYEQVFEYRGALLVKEMMFDRFEIVSLTSYEHDSDRLVEQQIKLDAGGYNADRIVGEALYIGDQNGLNYEVIERIWWQFDDRK